VTVDLPNGAQVTDRARVAEIAWDEFGRTVQLTVGSHSTDEDKAPAWVKQIRDLKRQVRHLKESQ
jgi:ribosomal protein L19E